MDAFFNFPIERPVNQLFFAFFAAVNLMAYTGCDFKKSEETEEPKTSKPFSENLKYIYSFIAICLKRYTDVKAIISWIEQTELK